MNNCCLQRELAEQQRTLGAAAATASARTACALLGEEVVALSLLFCAARDAPALTALRQSVADREARLVSSSQANSRIDQELAGCSRRCDALKAEETSLRSRSAALSSRSAALAAELAGVERASDGLGSERDAVMRELADERGASELHESLRRSSEWVRGCGADSGVLAVLCHAVRPCDASSERALLSVLGEALTTSLVVRTRADALRCSAALSRAGTGIRTLDIVDECSGEHAKLRNLPPRCTSLVDHVTLLLPEARPVVLHKLRRWLLFDGSAEEALRLRSALNVVALDGCKVLADGEIRTYASSMRGWPSRASQGQGADRAGLERRLADLDAELAQTREQAARVRAALAECADAAAANDEQLASVASSMASAEATLLKLEGQREAVPDAAELSEDRLRLLSLAAESEQEQRAILREVCEGCGRSDVDALRDELVEVASLRQTAMKLEQTERWTASWCIG